MAFTWTDETVFSDADMLWEVAIAVDSSNVPRIINNMNTISGFRYHDRTGGTWATESVNITKKADSSLSIVMDAEDKPRIVCVRGLGDYDQGYYVKSGETWTSSVADDTFGCGADNFLAIDESGNLHLSYYDELSTRANLKYGIYNGSAWSVNNVDTTGDVGDHNTIALSASGVPHIAYIDKTNLTLKHAWLDGTWQTETVDTGVTNHKTSIQIAPDGTIYIAYDKSSYLKLATYTDSWSIENVDGDGINAVGLYASMQLDPYGGIHIAYRHFDDMYIKYAYFNGSTWDISTPDGTTNQHSSVYLVLSDDGMAHLASRKNIGLDYEIHYFYAQVFTPSSRPLWVASPLGTLNRSMKPLGV